jgi:CBS domain containing-hemolysin-like protein
MIVRQIIVPRREVVFLKSHQTIEEVFDLVRRGRHTRYPVCEDSLDDVVGLLHIKDLMSSSVEEQKNWMELVRPVRSVPANMPVSRLLRQMQRTRQHMAVVLDEHGTSTGIVTLENVLEQIVGAVQDEFDMEAPEFETQGPDSFIVGGSLSIERLNNKLRLDLYAPGVDTLAGLLTSRLGRLVKVGDVVELPGVRAEVTEVRDDHPAKVHLTLNRDLHWTTENLD